MAKVVKFVPTHEIVGNAYDCTHLINNDTHATSGERTLCGIQLDGDDGIKPKYLSDYVTCEICIGIIIDVKALRKWRKPKNKDITGVK